MTWASIAVSAGTAVGSALLGSRTGRKERKRQEALEEQAALAERDRRQRLDATTATIDRAYDSPARQRQYQDFADALRRFYGADLGRQYTDAARRQKFALARSGLTGGSAAADASLRLGEERTRGELEAERGVRGSPGDLMSADQQSRLSLLSLAQSGLDTTTAAQRSATSLESNITSATTRSRAQGLGDIFAGTTDFYRRKREDAGRRKALGYRTDIYSAGGQ